MPLFKSFLPTLSLALALATPCVAVDNSKVTYDDPEAAAKDADFNLQGEYAAEIKDGDSVLKLGAHVIAQGNGKFHCVGYRGGLPGDGFDKEQGKIEADGKPADGGIEFVGEKHRGLLKGGVITVYDKESGGEICQLNKVNRQSPTLGAKAPEGATVLFDGKKNGFKDGAKKVTRDGLLIGGVFSEATFGDFTLHVEFRTPFQPGASGQGRGNSGVYMQGRYEVQVLDSFGLAGKDNECGGIYTIKPPDVNMCFPPLAWQTYDVDYTAARFDESGKKTAHAKMTVKHNGVLIHKDVECTKATTAAPVKEGKENGPIYLQDHGNPVRYRNIWIVEKK